MKATIAENRELNRDKKDSRRYFKMTLSGAKEASEGQPGQFVMLRGEDWGTDPLLPRPLSIYRFERQKREIEIVYRVIGKGTERLSGMREGQKVDLVGPLGRPFPKPDGSKRVILAAGAIGAPPLVAVAESILPLRPLLIIGGITGNDATFLKEAIEALGVETEYMTDDGSYGKRGTTIDALKKIVTKKDLVYACGPNKMLMKVAELSTEIGFNAFVSYEERMACGIGVCLGCAVPAASGGYLHSCSDGPVFNVNEIAWGRI